MTTWKIKEFNEYTENPSMDVRHVIKLDLSHNNLSVLPECIDNFINLQVLRLHNNKLTTLPESIDNLTSLQTLSLYDNELSTLPTSIGNLTNLQILNLDYNQLTTLPESIGNLTNLQILSLYVNELSTLPTSIGNLTNLQSLQFYDNQLTTLPTSIGNLTNLQNLIFNNNRLTTLPSSIGNLIHLRHINYYGNPIEYIPMNVQRLLNRQQNGQQIYQDRQSVHNHEIQETFRKSLYHLLNDKVVIDKDTLVQDILTDSVLDCKEQLLEYINIPDIHSTLQVSFLDVFLLVWQRITTHREATELKSILNAEMKDALCMCFTGRITRIVNCLNGFYDDIQIHISNNEQISNIISVIMRNESNIEKIKETFIKEMREREYSDEVINEWLGYIE
jgi:Leucine-rich repeat (LRR) protein